VAPSAATFEQHVAFAIDDCPVDTSHKLRDATSPTSDDTARIIWKLLAKSLSTGLL